MYGDIIISSVSFCPTKSVSEMHYYTPLAALHRAQSDNDIALLAHSPPFLEISRGVIISWPICAYLPRLSRGSRIVQQRFNIRHGVSAIMLGDSRAEILSRSRLRYTHITESEDVISVRCPRVDRFCLSSQIRRRNEKSPDCFVVSLYEEASSMEGSRVVPSGDRSDIGVHTSALVRDDVADERGIDEEESYAAEA